MTVIAPLTGSATAAYYNFFVPPNTFDLSVIAVANKGDPDQYLGVGFIPTNENYSYKNASSGVFSCISVQMPPAGTYYYLLRKYNADVDGVFKTAVFINSRLGCSSMVGYK